MAHKILQEGKAAISLEEFIEHVHHEVDFSDQESIMQASRELYKLNNNRDFIAEAVNANLKNSELERRNFYTGQAIILHSEKSFMVRAVTWLPESQNASKRFFEQDINSYGLAHDHAFNLLTIGYYGSGYQTDFYEYDREKVIGYVGEKVDIRFLERTQLGYGEILFIRESKDIHIQYPPAELSISLNLMSQSLSQSRNMEQFLFDVNESTIIGYPHFGVSNRTSLIDLAGMIADDNTIDILLSIAKQHSDPRTRLHAYKSLYRHLGKEILVEAGRDSHRLVNEAESRNDFSL